MSNPTLRDLRAKVAKARASGLSDWLISPTDFAAADALIDIAEQAHFLWPWIENYLAQHAPETRARLKAALEKICP